jgi:hypothetical protein
MDLMRREHPDLIGTVIGGKTVTDAYGCKKIYAYAKQAVVLNTAYCLAYGAYGPEAESIGGAGLHKRIVVADKALATGAYGWFTIEGPHDLLIAASAKGTAGDMVLVHTDGVVTCTDAAHAMDDDDEFAVLLEAKATGTSKTVLCYLTGEQIVWA